MIRLSVISNSNPPVDCYARAAHVGYFRGQFDFAAMFADHGVMADAAAWFSKAAA
jgi:hypothetical protein